MHITTYFIVWLIAACFVLAWSKEIVIGIKDAFNSDYFLKALPFIGIFVIGFGWWGYTAIKDIQGDKPADK